MKTMEMLTKEASDLQKYAFETAMKINELNMYRELGILGKDMHDSLHMNIQKRVVYTEAETIRIVEEMNDILERELGSE